MRRPGTCHSVAGCADQNQEQDQESDGTTVPRTLGPIPDLREGERREWHVCLPSKSAGCARGSTSVTRESVVHTKKQPAVDWAEASE